MILEPHTLEWEVRRQDAADRQKTPYLWRGLDLRKEWRALWRLPVMRHDFGFKAPHELVVAHVAGVTTANMKSRRVFQVNVGYDAEPGHVLARMVWEAHRHGNPKLDLCTVLKLIAEQRWGMAIGGAGVRPITAWAHLLMALANKYGHAL